MMPKYKRRRLPAKNNDQPSRWQNAEQNPSDTMSPEQIATAETTFRVYDGALHQRLVAGEPIKWHADGGRLLEQLPLASGHCRLLLSLTVQTEDDAGIWLTFALDQAAIGRVFCHAQAHSPATIMLAFDLPAPNGGQLSLQNASENPLILTQGSLNMLTAVE